jgi:hypothetical protein
MAKLDDSKKELVKKEKLMLVWAIMDDLFWARSFPKMKSDLFSIPALQRVFLWLKDWHKHHPKDIAPVHDNKFMVMFNERIETVLDENERTEITRFLAQLNERVKTGGPKLLLFPTSLKAIEGAEEWIEEREEEIRKAKPSFEAWYQKFGKLDDDGMPTESGGSPYYHRADVPTLAEEGFEMSQGQEGRPDRVRVDITEKNLSMNLRDTIAPLMEYNRRKYQQCGNPAFYFSNIQNELVKLREMFIGDGEKNSILKPEAYNLTTVKFLVDQCVEFIKCNASGDYQTQYPPDIIMKQLLSYAPEMPGFRLNRIIQCPVFTRAGTLHDKIGYDHKTRYYYHQNDPTLKGMDPIPSQVKTADLEKAKNNLLNEILYMSEIDGFAFVDKASQVNALALLLQPLVIDIIAAIKPIFTVQAAAAGSGKSCLIDVCSYVPMGVRAGIMSNPKNEELEKRLTACLISGVPYIVLDSVRVVSQEALLGFSTSEVWDGRILGFSKMVSLPTRHTTVIIVGNNPQFHDNMLRRLVLIELYVPKEQPMKRHFKFEDINVTWIEQHRCRMLWSALVLVKHWVDQGMNLSSITHPSFRRWGSVMSGIMEAAGIEGFLDNMEKTLAATDGTNPMKDAHRLIVMHMVSARGTGAVWRTQEIAEEVVEKHGIYIPDLSRGEGKSASLGLFLAKMSRAIVTVDGVAYRLVKAKSYAGYWKVERMDGGSTPSVDEEMASKTPEVPGIKKQRKPLAL